MAEEQKAAAAVAVAALVRDLMLSSRISEEARATGVACRMVRDPAGVPGDAKLLLVDLNLAGALEGATAWRARTGGKVVGFSAHMDTETIRAARAAGIDRVLTRGQLMQELAGILGSALK